MEGVEAGMLRGYGGAPTLDAMFAGEPPLQTDSRDLQSQYRELLTRVVELRSENESLVAERAKSDKHTRHKLAEAQTLLENKDSEIRELAEEVDQLKQSRRQKRDEMRGKMEEFETAMKQTKTRHALDIEKKDAQIESLRDRLRKYKKREQKAPKRDTSGRTALLEAENERLSRENATLKSDLAEHRMDDDATETSKGGQSLVAENERLRRIIETLTAKLKAQSEAVAARERQATNAQASLSAEIRAVRRDADEVNQVNERLRTSLEAAKTANDRLSDESAALKSEIAKLRREVETASIVQAKLDAAESAKDRANLEVAEMRTRIGNDKEAAKQVKKRLQMELETLTEKSTKENEALKADLADVIKDRDTKVMENGKLTRELENAVRRRKEMKQEIKAKVVDLEVLNKVKTQLTLKAEDLDAKIRQLNDENETLGCEHESSLAQLDRLTQAMRARDVDDEKMRERTEGLANELEGLRRRLREEMGDREKTEMENRRLSTEVGQLEGAIVENDKLVRENRRLTELHACRSSCGTSDDMASHRKSQSDRSRAQILYERPSSVADQVERLESIKGRIASDHSETEVSLEDIIRMHRSLWKEESEQYSVGVRGSRRRSTSSK